MKTKIINVEMQKNYTTGKYHLYIDDKLLGIFRFKFTAKRALRQYIRNGSFNRVKIWNKTFTLKG